MVYNQYYDSRTILRMEGFCIEVQACSPVYISHSEPREGEPRQPNKANRPIRDYSGLFGLTRPDWEDLAPPLSALIASMTIRLAGMDVFMNPGSVLCCPSNRHFTRQTLEANSKRQSWRVGQYWIAGPCWIVEPYLRWT